MKRLLIAGVLAAAANASQAGSARIDPAATVAEVFKAERDFAAYTKDHGYTMGFLDWSTPDAIVFQPQIVRIHDKLAADLAADPALADKPTPLRWRPFYAGAASSGDIAFDMGPWTIDGSDSAGWFFTIWEKQADGSWRWSIDGRAGSDAPASLPPPNVTISFTSRSAHDKSGGLDQGLAQDDALNSRLGKVPPARVYDKKTSIASDGVPPYVAVYKPWPKIAGLPEPLSQKAITAIRTAALAARPAPGMTWTRDGQGAGKSGDFVYTYGHASAADGSYAGHYVRVWQKLTPAAGNWVLTVDVFQT